MAWLLVITCTLAIGASGCGCSEIELPKGLQALAMDPHPPGWPDDMRCCGESGRYEFTFAATYSWANVSLSWSSPSKLGVSVALTHCEPRDAGDCLLSRTLDNETAPASDGFYRGYYRVSGQRIILGVTMKNPEPAAARFGLNAHEDLGTERAGCLL
jgi:hypothetical protein